MRIDNIWRLGLGLILDHTTARWEGNWNP